jgi:hypothetical protein
MRRPLRAIFAVVLGAGGCGRAAAPPAAAPPSFDIRQIASPDQLRRVRSVRAEVINAAVYEGKDDWRPRTEAEFVAYMESQGFAFEKDTSVTGNRDWLDKSFVK